MHLEEEKELCHHNRPLENSHVLVMWGTKVFQQMTSDKNKVKIPMA